ncbi:Death on curing protein, Doc toxin [Caballeronia sordidicola]|uniref:Death on curing protein, Doc toxin n=1 Tax=Caballeronia sordidicola TaxID=196367 RepID=A0A242M3E9_CABSO|nr:Death on curing protein, Doc toxin [Caballeronia sordidicola]
MLLRLKWRPLAETDLLDILDYIGQDNPDAALSLVEMIRDKTEALRTRPKMYREGRMRGTREMVVHRNYIVFYRVSEDTVTIQRVKHTRQQWP